MDDRLTEPPLRILAVINLPWDPRLGAARVWIELADEWRKTGHHVEKFCLTDAFGTPTKSPPQNALRMMLFPFRARAFIRRNAGRFDLIDALVSTLPFRKKSLRFPGLVVTRSVGLYLLYEKFERIAKRRWPAPERGKLTGRLFYRFFQWRMRRASDATLKHCDLLNVPNSDELRCVRDDNHSRNWTIMQPYGLTSAQHEAHRAAAEPAEQRLAHRRVCFLGMWSARKGAKDWGEIVRLVRARVPSTRFVFLGTMIDTKKVLVDLEIEESDFIDIVPEFRPDELPRLLGTSTVGAFPSYVEGFGLAVIEQLASGIPVVAYDAPGPRDILSRHLPEMLIPPGDVRRFSDRISEVLEAELSHYAGLCARSFETGAEFSWRKIAADTLAEYRRGLRDIPAVQPRLI